MLRAEAAGLIDFSRFDPRDSWWWRKLSWAVDELETQQFMDVARMRHNHWVTILTKPNLSQDSVESAKVEADTSLRRFLQGAYPWMAEELEKQTSGTSQEELVTRYQEEFGKPGDAKYDEMIQGLAKVFKKGKLSPSEKMEVRDRAREKKQADKIARMEGVK